MSGVRGPSWASSFQGPDDESQAAGAEVGQQLGESTDQDAIQGGVSRPVRTAEDSGQKLAGQTRDLLGQGDQQSLATRLQTLAAGVGEAQSADKKEHAQSKINSFVTDLAKDGTLKKLIWQSRPRSAPAELRQAMQQLQEQVEAAGSQAAKQAWSKALNS